MFRLAGPIFVTRSAVVLAGSFGVGANVDELRSVAVALGDPDDLATLASRDSLDVDFALAGLALFRVGLGPESSPDALLVLGNWPEI